MQQVKDVLYIHLPERLEALKGEFLSAQLRLLAAEQGGSSGGDLYLWPSNGAGELSLRLRVTGFTEAPEHVRNHYYNLLVIDTRGADVQLCSIAADLIEELQRDTGPERAFPANRIVAVIDDRPDLAQRTFELGRLRVRSFVTHPFEEGGLRGEIDRILIRGRKVGKVALCLSGGGVEGLLFELGVIRALNAYLENRSITECDIFCGISAGSILASFLANGVEPREIIHGLEGREGGIEPIGPNLLYDFDVKTLAKKALAIYKALIGNPSPDLLVSRLMKAVPNGVFRGRRFEAMVERELTKSGRTNNFEQVKPELYIGATDLDTFEHRIFGLPDNRHVPISRAVRASCGLMPFYGPTEVDGRYYVDGQYTRTANFHLAVERGATLILVLDPLVPLMADRAGYVAAKGGLFASIQGIKGVIHTRFTNAIAHAAEAYPDVNFHVFTPEQEDRLVLSGSPMKYTVRTQIIDVAYRCAVEKIHDRADLLRVHMARHGFQLRSSPRPR